VVKVYDYFEGGAQNLAIDRATADKAAAAFPRFQHPAHAASGVKVGFTDASVRPRRALCHPTHRTGRTLRTDARSNEGRAQSTPFTSAS
jgi:hypothetical protein